MSYRKKMKQVGITQCKQKYLSEDLNAISFATKLNSEGLLVIRYKNQSGNIFYIDRRKYTDLVHILEFQILKAPKWCFFFVHGKWEI